VDRHEAAGGLGAKDRRGEVERQRDQDHRSDGEKRRRHPRQPVRATVGIDIRRWHSLAKRLSTPPGASVSYRILPLQAARAAATTTPELSSQNMAE
jgi:hypothetical protein